MSRSVAAAGPPPLLDRPTDPRPRQLCGPASGSRRRSGASSTRPPASPGGRSRASPTARASSSSSATSSSRTGTTLSRASRRLRLSARKVTPLTSSTSSRFIPYVPGLHHFKKQIVHRCGRPPQLAQLKRRADCLGGPYLTTDSPAAGGGHLPSLRARRSSLSARGPRGATSRTTCRSRTLRCRTARPSGRQSTSRRAGRSTTSSPSRSSRGPRR